MTNQGLSIKLNYILKRLHMNKQEFLLACRKINPTISKPTILNVINGTNKGFPTLETIETIMSVCKISDDPLLNKISYNYLMDDSVSEVIDESHAQDFNPNLTGESLEILEKSPYAHSQVLNYYIQNYDVGFWDYSHYLYETSKIQSQISDIIKVCNNASNIKNISDLFTDFKTQELAQIRKKSSKKTYKTFLLEKLNYTEIFNNSLEIEELESNYLGMYQYFSTYLSDILFDYISGNDFENATFTNDDLKNFLAYLKSNYKYSRATYFNKVDEGIRQIDWYFKWVSVYYKDFLKDNFKDQLEAIQGLINFSDMISAYKKSQICLDQQAFDKLLRALDNISSLLSVLNKYCRYGLSEYNTEIYNKMLTIKDL